MVKITLGEIDQFNFVQILVVQLNLRLLVDDVGLLRLDYHLTFLFHSELFLVSELRANHVDLVPLNEGSFPRND
jgi:hypothetical protein